MFEGDGGQSFGKIASDVDIGLRLLAVWKQLRCGPVELEVLGLQMVRQGCGSGMDPILLEELRSNLLARN